MKDITTNTLDVINKLKKRATKLKKNGWHKEAEQVEKKIRKIINRAPAWVKLV